MAADPSAFLLAYEGAVLEAGGDDKVMANWLPMALAGEPRAWLLNLPGSIVASWEELCGLFTALRYTGAPHGRGPVRRLTGASLRAPHQAVPPPNRCRFHALGGSTGLGCV